MKCSKCGGEYNFNDSACGKCGSLTKEAKFALWLVLIAFIIFFLMPEKGKNPPVKTRSELINSQFSGWDGSHRELKNYITGSMNDPESYEHIETKYVDKGDNIIIITRFRGNNAFGGKVVNTIRAKVDLQGNIIEILN